MYQGALLGLKAEDLGINNDILGHVSDKRELPIKIQEQMIPCKQVLCYFCAVSQKHEFKRV